MTTDRFGSRWDAGEDASLRKNWKRLSLEVLSERLGRTPYAIRARAGKLALVAPRPSVRAVWSTEMLAHLRERYAITPTKLMARQLSAMAGSEVTKNAVVSRARRLGLTLPAACRSDPTMSWRFCRPVPHTSRAGTDAARRPLSGHVRSGGRKGEDFTGQTR